MTEQLSLNTKAILLLTAPLIAGRDRNPTKLLSPGEYKSLAQQLRGLEREPADLIGRESADLREACQGIVSPERLEALLSRGFQLSQAVERWQTRALWVVSRADSGYPRRFKSRLREDSPPILYGCGNQGLLEAGGLAVVGSRNIDADLIDYTECIGRLAASSGKALISGGARGVDQAAMMAALAAGGQSVGVLASDLEKATTSREQRNVILDGRLVLVSPYDPSARFNVGHAMQRNKLIYALADAALIVNAEAEKGGTWAGAQEQLKRYHFVAIYLRSSGTPSEGLKALEKLGARPWPNPGSVREFHSLLGELPPKPLTEEQQDFAFEAPAPDNAIAETSALGAFQDDQTARTDEALDASELTNATSLFDSVRKHILALLDTPMTTAEIASALDLSPKQTEIWLKRLSDEKSLQKLSRPVRYARPPSSTQ